MAARTLKAGDSSPDEKPPDVVWARRTPRVRKELKKRSPKTPKTEISELVSILGEQNGGNDASPPHLLDMWLRAEGTTSSASSGRGTPGSVRRVSKRRTGDHPLAELRKKKQSESIAAMQQQLTMLEKENLEPQCGGGDVSAADLEELVGSLDAALFDGIDDDVPLGTAEAADSLPCSQLLAAPRTTTPTALGTRAPPSRPKTGTAAAAKLPPYAPPRVGGMLARHSGGPLGPTQPTATPGPVAALPPIVPSPQDLQRIQINQKRAAALRRKRQRERRQALS